MMDWTDRHCRYFHRLFAPHALLYTEMIVSAAIVRGNAAKLLEHDAREHPLALQLGGCDPIELAAAARIGAEAGYREINLNVGCPSDRVKSGAFGACLMLRPALVADCVRAMREAVRAVSTEGAAGPIPVTVKCRIGIDDQDSYEFFENFVDHVVEAGVDALIVHARAAILGGLALPAEAADPAGQADPSASGAAGRRRALSPKENREIPPLHYEYVHRLRMERPTLPLVINGGLGDLPTILAQTEQGLGVMLGRAAYHHPALLAAVERAVANPTWQIPQPADVIEPMVAYARAQAARGTRLHSVTRHMHGLMAGRDGARAWRRFLSEVAARPEASPETLYAALPILTHALAA